MVELPDKEYKDLQSRVKELEAKESERKRVEEALKKSEEKYRGIFDESVVAIYIFDARKNFIDANQAGLDLLGYTRKELLQMSIPDVDADPVQVIPAHKKLLAGGRLVNYEHKLKRKDGAIITVLNNSKPLIDAAGNAIGMQSTLIDITERQRAEEMKNELIVAVSHELKSPVATIQMGQQIGKNAIAKGDQSGIESFYSIVSTNIGRLSKDVDKIVDAFQLEYRKGRVKTISLQPALNKLFCEAIPLAQAKELKIRSDISPAAKKVKFPVWDLNTLIRNLLDNAIKFSHKGLITVSSKLKGDRIELSIKDRGRGLSPQEKERIFERFFKGSAALPGVGLGLSVCKKIVERNGGTIKLRSPGRGKGTTVIVSLPKGGKKNG